MARPRPLAPLPDEHRRRKRWVVVVLAAALLGLALWALFVPLKSEAWGPCSDDGALSYLSSDEGGDDHCDREAQLRVFAAGLTAVTAPVGAFALLRWLLPPDRSRTVFGLSKLLWGGIWLAFAGNVYLAFASRAGGLQSNDVTIRMERLGEGNRVRGALTASLSMLVAGVAIAVVAAALARSRARRSADVAS